MPEPLTTKINDWRIVYSHIWSDLYNAHNRCNYLEEQATAHNWEGMATQFGMLANDLYNIAYHFKGGSPNLYSTMYYGMDWIDDNWPENGEPPPPYELTATKICEAWAVNEFEDRALTIGFIDRMRQLVWDEPFYVAWAARPKV